MPLPSSEAEPFRRLPQQARSRQRVNQILDAAIQVFEEFGYEAASTELIATRANTSIGSLYRFFPDKSAILYALAERYAEQLRELSARVFAPTLANRPIFEVLSKAIDAFEDFYTTQPVYRVVFLQSQASLELQAINKRLDRQIAVQFDAFLALRQSTMEPERRRLVAIVSVEIANALQLFSWTQDNVLRQQVVAETKNVLISYLQPLFPDCC